MSAASARVRAARPGDAAAIFELIRGLAAYERLESELVGSAAALERDLFGPAPGARALVAEDGSEAPRLVGYALYFGTYSTFLTRRGIWLEDLFVLPEARGQGTGRALLAAVAAEARATGAGRLEWSVLDWNEPALRFYRRLGAVPMETWTTQRLTGAALEALAAEASP